MLEDWAGGVLIPLEDRAPDGDGVEAAKVPVLVAPFAQHVEEGLVHEGHPAVNQKGKLLVPDGVADERVEHREGKAVGRDKPTARRLPGCLSLPVRDRVLQRDEGGVCCLAQD